MRRAGGPASPLTGVLRRARSSPRLVALGAMLPLTERRIGQALTGLFVVCLLLCHGAFGALHLFSVPSTLTAPAGEHAAKHSPDEERGEAGPGEHPLQHRAATEYFAVLFGLLVGAALLLLRSAWRWCQVHAPRLFGNRLPVVVPNLPRGPTAPLLQVFRL